MPGIDWYQKIDEIRESGGFAGKAETIILGSSGDADYSDLQEAIDAARDWVGDTILVKQTEESAYSQDTEIAIDCPGLTIKAANIGGIPEAMAENVTFRLAAGQVTPTATITQPVHIKGIGFTTRNVTTGDKESAALHIEGSGGYDGCFNFLENCRFSCWYGAQEYGIYFFGGGNTRIEHCTFDGLFGGFGTAAIGLDDNGTGTTPDFVRLIENYFDGLGSSIPAVKLITGATVKGLLMLRNVNNNGYGTRGVLLNNDSIVSAGLIAENYTGLANKAAAFLNLTNSNLSFQDNHYNE